MAEIDTNPLTPVWPQRPTRNIAPEDQDNKNRQRRKQRQEDNKKKSDGDGNSSPHIDEYA